MTCKEFMTMIQPFIDNKLDYRQLEDFLTHFHHCKDCQEELEIFYTVLIGVQRLDQTHGKETLNLTDDLTERLLEARRRVLLHNAFLHVQRLFTVLAGIAVIAAFILQLNLF